MEFWGVEVKAGKPLKVDPGFDYMIHLSQAALGESKNTESVPLYVTVMDKKILLGTLSSQNFPQLSFDIVFEQQFELSHNWKHGSVYLCGYKTLLPGDDDFGSDDSEDFSSEEEAVEEDAPAENGKPKVENATSAKGKAVKADSSAKDIAKSAEPVKGNKSEDDDSDSEDESDSESEGDSEDDDEMAVDDDSDEDEDEETPVKVVSAKGGKKRPTESATKTPPVKKAKAASAQKTDGKKGADGKKGGHTATPYPSKKGGKSNETPKIGSSSSFSCKSCSKTFGSEKGLESHQKAKHGSK